MCDWAKSRDDIYGEHTTVVYGEGRVRAGWGTSRPAQGKPPAEGKTKWCAKCTAPFGDNAVEGRECRSEYEYCGAVRGLSGALHGYSHYCGRVSGEPRLGILYSHCELAGDKCRTVSYSYLR